MARRNRRKPKSKHVHLLSIELRDFEDIFDVVCVRCSYVKAYNVPAEGIAVA